MTKPVLLSGRANEDLAFRIGSLMGIQPCGRTLEEFPDHELHVELHMDVGGCDVYIVQPTSPPVGSHLLELMLLADGCARAGAARHEGKQAEPHHAGGDGRGQLWLNVQLFMFVPLWCAYIPPPESGAVLYATVQWEKVGSLLKT